MEMFELFFGEDGTNKRIIARLYDHCKKNLQNSIEFMMIFNGSSEEGETLTLEITNKNFKTIIFSCGKHELINISKYIKGENTFIRETDNYKICLRELRKFII